MWQIIKEKDIKFPADVPDIATTDEENPVDDGEENKDKENSDRESKENNKTPSLNDIMKYMITLEPITQKEVLQKLENCVNCLKGDLEAIERVAREIAEDARDNGILYLEVGLDPTKFVLDHEDNFIGTSDVVEAALKGFKDAEKYTNTKAGVLLQVEKGQTKDSEGLVSLVNKFKDNGVVGIELTCNDQNVAAEITEDGGSLENLLFSPDDIEFMEKIQKQKINRSVQAGEFGHPEMIFQAIEKLHADRIVYGYSVVQDPSLFHDCITNKIHFEVTPSLSILNSSVPTSAFYHPMVQFAEENMNFSLNTGLPVITGGWLVQEYELAQSWGLTETHLASATFNAARAAFAEDQEKKDLMKDLRKIYGMEDKVDIEIFINHKCGLPDDPRRKLRVQF